MTISLCMPVFKRPEMLANCLGSILRQTYQEFEVILKDGCLAEPALCEPLLKEPLVALGSRLRYIFSADDGIFPAVNEALANATGDILHFICSDDQLGDNDALASVAAAFKDYERTPVWLYGITGGMNEAGERTDHASGVSMTYIAFKKQRGGIGQPSIFWNRAMYECVGEFDVNYKRAADFDMWNRFFLASHPIYLPKVLGIGRSWPGCASTIDCKLVEEEAAQISERYR